MSAKLLKWGIWAFLGLALPVVLYMVLFLRAGTDAEIRSVSLDEMRRITVYLPAGYGKAPKRRYPVVYSLDGEKTRHGALMASNARMMAGIGVSPSAIVVAVHTHGKRERDFAPAGGAARFAGFFEKELIPYIDGRFRTSGFNIVSGHSYGGLFAVYAFANHPQLFDAHFAFVPSFFHDESVIRDLAEAPMQAESPARRLFLYSGLESERFWQGYGAAVEVLAARKQSGVTWSCGYFPLPHPLIMVPGQIAALSSLGGAEPAGSACDLAFIQKRLEG